MATSDGSAHGSQRDLERPFLKVPYELLNKTFRQAQKSIEKDLGVLDKAVNEMNKKKNVSNDDACKFLDKIVHKLSGVKRKLEETDASEEQQLNVCKKRLEHLDQFPIPPIGSQLEEQFSGYQAEKAAWSKIRLNRILVDYLLRQGYYDAALALADSTNITDFVDIEIFKKSRDVIEGLKRRECTEALNWCTDNKSKLKKFKSNLEFRLRTQEFVELIREDKKRSAIQYAQKQITPLVSECEDKEQREQWMSLVHRTMALLAFGKNTTVLPYCEFFNIKCWDQLVAEFQHDNFQLYSLTTRPLVHLSLQAGLSALKTPFAYQEEYYNVNDPLCNRHFKQLAEGLPFSFHIHSKLVCRITGKIMDDRNPPMILPNGNAYSLQGVEQLISKSADKKSFVDPRSGTTYQMSQLKKALII